MEMENKPNSIFITEGRNPYLFETQNGSILLLYSEYNWIPEQEYSGADIFIISSKNGLDWGNISQITNDTFRNIRPELIQQNESSLRLYYSSGNWKYIESNDLKNWSNPILCDEPFKNQYWSEINNPPFFEQAKEYPHHYSLIKNHNGKYIFVGIHDISSTDYQKPKLFVMTSNNGKEWSLPIMISEKDCHHFSQSIIEIENGTYMVAYQYTENHDDKIGIITFTDPDLENLNGPHFVYYEVLTMCFVFLIIFIIIIDVLIIREQKKNWKK